VKTNQKRRLLNSGSSTDLGLSVFESRKITIAYNSSFSFCNEHGNCHCSLWNGLV